MRHREDERRPTRIDSARPRERRQRRDPREMRERARENVERTRDALDDLGITTFRADYRKLMRLVGAEDFTSERAMQALVRAQLSMAINAMPRVEESVQKYGGKAVYSMVTLGDHIRALTQDVRGIGDQSATVEKVRRDVIQPSLGALATDLVSQITEITSELHQSLPPGPARAVGRRLRALQEGLTRAFSEAEGQAHELLQKSLAT